MDFSWLPPYIQQGLFNLNEQFLSEIHLREGQPVVVYYQQKWSFLSKNGITQVKDNAVKMVEVNSFFIQICQNEMLDKLSYIKKGFWTLQNGCRIGIAGEYVLCGEDMLSIKNITSLTIRIPHILVYKDMPILSLWDKGVKSTLLYGKPASGKTTLLRYLTSSLGNKANGNILLLDERSEVSINADLGFMTDVILGGIKQDCIENAIRSLNPSVVLTDEIDNKNDQMLIKICQRCNIPLIATTHFEEKKILRTFNFDFYIHILGVGELIIYDKDFNAVGNYHLIDHAWSMYKKDI